MNSRILLLVVFAAGLSIGWFGNSWLKSGLPVIATTERNEDSLVQGENVSVSSSVLTLNNSNEATPNTGDAFGKTSQRAQPDPAQILTVASSSDLFNRYLGDGRYQEAINLYQEQKLQNTEIADHLRKTLLTHLERLTSERRNSDFSTLIESYLSVYYDDVDVLLLLADFNRDNGSFLEVVDVYLLAKTYAYTDIDRQKVSSRFNGFVEELDKSYTGQENWWPLINFYSHVVTSGLMTSSHQYRQALAHLRAGDEAFAIDQLNKLLDDGVVGEAAALVLNSLSSQTVAPVIGNTSVTEYAESIALQRVGNQYAVNLGNNRQKSVALLIDTGASMTALSSKSFNSLGIGVDAVESDRRVFRTAGGVVMGTVFTVPELRLGPYLLKNTQIAVIDFEADREIDGLLGMNILGQFRFHIDQENALLQLSEK